MDNDINEFLLAGADAVLAKPLRCEVLDQIMEYTDQNGFTSVVKKGARLTFSVNSFNVNQFNIGR